MARKQIKLVDKNSPKVANLKFTLNGKEYHPGDSVDMTGVADRQLVRLLKYRFIRNEEAQDVSALLAEPEPETSVELETDTEEPETPVEPDTEESAELETVEEPETPVERIATLKHVGGGQYLAFDAEEKQIMPEKVKGKENIKAFVEQLGYAVTK